MRTTAAYRRATSMAARSTLENPRPISTIRSPIRHSTDRDRAVPGKVGEAKPSPGLSLAG